MSLPRVSSSQKMFERFERRKYWRRFVAILFLTVYAAYLFWRCTIINHDSLTLSLLYLFAEGCGFILGFNIIVRSWSYNYRAPKPVLENRSVDIFIPTYKEPEHIIRRTLMAAKAIEYPHQTWVLDDGHREEIKKIAAEIGVNYLSRPQNIHAKAGNLNYGLRHSKAEFVMVFDADHIALPHALDITLGMFVDEKVAMVQTPQDYYNSNSFQYTNCKKTGALWSDQSFFYNIAEPCYDSIDSACCVGTGVVYRRKVLDEIGGIPTKTVTEDTHTSIRMNILGYKTVYLNESIAYGIAVSDLSEYHKTRQRWGHGNIQVIKNENLFFRKELSIFQRLLHFPSFCNCLEGWQQMLLLFIPICTLTFGLSPFEISVFNVIVTFCFPFFSYAMLQELGCGFSRLWTNEIFSMIRWLIHLQVSKAWFGADLKWKSSAKNIKGAVSWGLMLPQIILLLMSVISLLTAFFTLQKTGFKIGPLFLFLKEKFLAIFGLNNLDYQPISVHAVLQSGYTLDLVLVAGIWVLYNIFRAIFFIRKEIHDCKNSHEFYRFNTPFPVTINAEKKIIGKILQISEEWLEFCSSSTKEDEIKIGEYKKILIHLPAEILDLEILVEKIVGKNISGRIIWNSIKARDALAAALYSVDWHREFLNRNAYFLTPSDFILKILRVKLPFDQKYQQWNCLLYQGKPAVVAEFIGQKNLASIILFEEFVVGEIISGRRIFAEKSQEISLKIVAEESLSSLVEKGLDGAVTWRYRVEILLSEFAK